MAGDVSAGRRLQSTSPRRTSARVCDTVSPLNSREPESISNRRTPNDQISQRLSTAWPLACSGLMYAAVPRMIPALVEATVSVGDCSIAVEPAGAELSNALARPKSSTLTSPSDRTLTLAGFRSR